MGALIGNASSRTSTNTTRVLRTGREVPATLRAASSALLRRPCNSVGKSGSTTANRRGRPPTKEDYIPTKVCPSCFGPQAKGIAHRCSRTSKLENTLTSFSPKSKEKLCSTILKDRSRQEGSLHRIPLATTSGKNLEVSLFREPWSDEEVMSSEELCRLQVGANLSGKFLSVTNFICNR